MDNIPHRKFFHYDPTINLGHIFTILSILFGVMLWGMEIEKANARQDQQIITLQHQYGEIKTYLIRIDDKLDKKMDKR